MKQLVRNMAFSLTLKRVNEGLLNVESIELKPSDVSYFSLSSNTIVSFTLNEKLCYFRECPRIYPFYEYFGNAINSFFSSLDRLGISKEHFKQEIPIKLDFSKQTISSFKQYTDNKKSNKGFVKTLSRADIIANKCSFSIWENRPFTTDFFKKFDMGDIDAALADIAVYFLWYMRSAAYNYRMLKIARGKEHSFFGAVRSVASAIVAEELGLKHMITSSRFCVLNIEGNTLFGVISDAAPGARMVDSIVSPSGSLQKELTGLNVLDVISYQVDHSPNNYNVAAGENGTCMVCAFDNDNPRTFFPIPGIEIALSGCDAFVKDGIVARPHFDKALAVRLKTLDVRALKKRLKPYLNSLQIWALVCRLKKLNKAIVKTEAATSNFLVDEGGWSEESAFLEASGRYGVTYLKKAIMKD